MSNGNLPPGCTAADIERAAGGDTVCEGPGCACGTARYETTCSANCEVMVAILDAIDSRIDRYEDLDTFEGAGLAMMARNLKEEIRESLRTLRQQDLHPEDCGVAL